MRTSLSALRIRDRGGVTHTHDSAAANSYDSQCIYTHISTHACTTRGAARIERVWLWAVRCGTTHMAPAKSIYRRCRSQVEQG